MRPILLILAVLSLAVSGATAARTSSGAAKVATGTTFVLTGRGWGHGVGLSQCGALGYAQRGWNYGRIVGHYYRGTKVTSAPAARVRVLLADGRRSLRISSRTAFKVRDGNGETYPLAAGAVNLGTGLKVKVEPDRPARALPGPLTFIPGKAALGLEKPYRGQLVVKATGGALRAVNSIPVDMYLYGVVPLEIGSDGPVEALKAQAVAARSYSLASRRSGDFDLYPDTRSQVYGGADAEKPETTAAVDATAGKVITYKGKVISTYYFASSGGRTASVEDAWPGSRPVPYLVSVDDPYDGVCSTVHSWGPYKFSGSSLARRLGVSSRVVDARTVVNDSKRVTTLQVKTSGGQVSLTGTAVRETLDLRSTWFRLGVLSLARPAAAAVYGVGVELTGIARGIKPVFLDQRVPGKEWARATRVKTASDGTFAVRVKPKRALDYRLTAARASGGSVRVTVAPRLRLAPGAVPGDLEGSVRPAFADARIDLQRRGGGGWTRVASTRTDDVGSFAASLDPVPGTYRARIAARQGFAAGTSPVVEVTG
jgi:SpoIID/LytB domain protein